MKLLVALMAFCAIFALSRAAPNPIFPHPRMPPIPYGGPRNYIPRSPPFYGGYPPIYGGGYPPTYGGGYDPYPSYDPFYSPGPVIF